MTDGDATSGVEIESVCKSDLVTKGAAELSSHERCICSVSVNSVKFLEPLALSQCYITALICEKNPQNETHRIFNTTQKICRDFYQMVQIFPESDEITPFPDCGRVVWRHKGAIIGPYFRQHHLLHSLTPNPPPWWIANNGNYNDAF